MRTRAIRYHDFSAGHRVVGHESKCANLHGHNYRVFFECERELEPLDVVGRVIDFSVMKTALCEWLELEWDHRLLISHADPWATSLRAVDPTVVIVPFNPTAENMARYLLLDVGPENLEGTDVQLIGVTVEETRKCSARVFL